MAGHRENLSVNVLNAISIAEVEAKEFGVREIDNLILFLAILAEAESAGAATMRSLGIDYQTAKPVASKFFRFAPEPGALGRLQQAVRNLQLDVLGVPLSRVADQTLIAANISAQNRNSQILGEDLLLSIIQQRDPEVITLLGKLKVNILVIQERLLALIETETQYN